MQDLAEQLAFACESFDTGLPPLRSVHAKARRDRGSSPGASSA
jgi:hypothetical protein